MLLSLDTSKATGPDGISAKMFKGTALSITPVLMHLFSMSIQSGIFPEKWKLSSVVPIPKGGDLPTTGQFPYYLLLAKCMSDMHVHHLLTQHLASDHPPANSQWGFQ